MKTIPFTNFLGINNRLPDFSLRVATSQLNGQYLRTADNVDINNAGKLRRRNATKLLQPMTGAHSIFMATDTAGFMVRSGVLYSIVMPVYSETMLKILSTDDTMSYALIGDDLFFSNDTDSGRITAGVYNPIGLPTPSAPPLTTIAGALLPGWYQVSVSYASYTGAAGVEDMTEEGGVSASTNVELTVTGGLRVTLPGVTPGATHVNVHLSSCNGSEAYFAFNTPTSTTTVDLTVLATGRDEQQRFEDVLPAGKLFTSNGRLCSMKDNMVYIGLPFRYGYYLPAEGYIPFLKPVTVAVENQGGTYIATEDTTYWFPGDLGDIKSIIPTIFPYGGVPGTAFRLPNNSLCGWFSAKGVVFGPTNGEAEADMSDKVDQTPPASGHSIVFETDGYRRVVSCGWCVNLGSKAVTSYSGWDFTSVSGSYGTKSDGIYQINTTGYVDASVGFGKQDFRSEQLKHLPNVYLGVDSADAMQLRVQLPDDLDYTYEARNSSADLKIQRVDPGLGLRANWYDLTLLNQGGEDFTLASVSFAPTASSRRIA